MSDSKPFLFFEPLKLVRSCKIEIKFESGIIIDENNWPSNLVYNHSMLEGDEYFFETFCSDTTLLFYRDSAVGRVVSLASRGCSNPEEKWEHGPIYIVEIGGKCREPWMTRTSTKVALRRIE